MSNEPVVPPSAINAKPKVMWGAFRNQFPGNSFEDAIYASWVVRYCQSKDNWDKFSFGDFSVWCTENGFAGREVMLGKLADASLGWLEITDLGSDDELCDTSMLEPTDKLISHCAQHALA